MARKQKRGRNPALELQEASELFGPAAELFGPAASQQGKVLGPEGERHLRLLRPSFLPHALNAGHGHLLPNAALRMARGTWPCPLRAQHQLLESRSNLSRGLLFSFSFSFVLLSY